MKITSPHDMSYSARWTRGRLEVFYNDESMGKVRITALKKAKEIFDAVVHTKLPLQDIADFHEATQDMIGVDLSKMRYTEDRHVILYEEKFFAYGTSTEMTNSG